MEQDPLIAYNWESTIQFFSLLLLIASVTLIGFLSRKLEGAIFFSLVAGGCLLLLVLPFFINSKLHFF